MIAWRKNEKNENEPIPTDIVEMILSSGPAETKRTSGQHFTLVYILVARLPSKALRLPAARKLAFDKTFIYLIMASPYHTTL